ncbi:uncharacterized protein LOC124788720 [Schistocerca piceifrons]|uniref:uncharacterized protein LOC124788720 n=1 Tax=Schistocerca piceifrons TaxID=274613 RepID=UPI001F5ED8D1|nr:uncharacterized protein LOC124788720 [Schistocerca piceifrons]
MSDIKDVAPLTVKQCATEALTAMATLDTMTGLAVFLVLVTAALGAHQQSLADPPVCPERIPGVTLNITFYPNEDDCTKYWECDNGNLYNGSCTDGLIWNPNVDSCDWPYNYDCPYDRKLPIDVIDCPQPSPGESFNVTFYPNEEDCTKYWECDNGLLRNGSCPNGLIWNNDLQVCDWPYNYDCPYDKKGLIVFSDATPDCPQPSPGEIFNVTFYPNEEDCTLYWECDNGLLRNGSCPNGLIWNNDLQACDWPYNYDCPYDKKGLIVFSDATPDCPQPSPGEIFNVTFYPNEEDCTLYWECDNGLLRNGSCPNGLIWNNDLQACDWPYNYDCPYDKKGLIVLSDATPDCPQPSPGEIFNVTFYPNEEDCTLYWECDNGLLRNGSCPNGLIWNNDLQACDWPYNYDCPYDKKGLIVLSDATPDCPQPSPGEIFNVTFYPNEEDCTKYWECDNGLLRNGSCPNGLIWNNDLQACDWPYNYDCPYDKKGLIVLSDATPDCPQPSPGEIFNVTFYPNEEDCTLYWECDNGLLRNGSCPNGLIWNNDLQACDWPYNYDCPYDKKGLIVLSDATPDCPQPSPGEVFNVTFYPNEEDCTKYFECDNGLLRNASCPNGLIWNNDLQVCDWPYNYDCPYDKKESSSLRGLAVILVLVAAALGAHQQSLADPPVCPERIPGVTFNFTFYPNEDDCTRPESGIDFGVVSEERGELQQAEIPVPVFQELPSLEIQEDASGEDRSDRSDEDIEGDGDSIRKGFNQHELNDFVLDLGLSKKIRTYSIKTARKKLVRKMS